MKRQQPPQKTPLAAAIAGAMDFSGGFDDWFEIFRAGEQTDSQGRTRTFTEADLDSIVANHSDERAAPLVVGHPKTNDPAYGWTQALKRDGDTLFARGRDVAAEFEQAVAQQHFPKRSISILPDGNGGWRLRHIGFLGAAAPAVAGLKDLNFSEQDDAVAFEFSLAEPVRESGWALSSIGRLLRGLREFLIDKHDLEVADNVLPDYELEAIASAATSINEQTHNNHSAFSAAEEKDMPTQQELDNERTRAEQAEQRLAKMEYNQKVSSNQVRINQLINEGRLLPAQATGLAEFMAALPDQDDQTFEFSAAEGEAPKQLTPYQFMDGLLNALGKQVELGSTTTDEGDEPSHSYNAPAGCSVNPERAEQYEQALQYAEKHGCTFEEAARKLEKQS